MRRNGGLRWVGKKVDARLRRPRARMSGLLRRTSTFFPISVPDLTWGALIGAPRIRLVESGDPLAKRLHVFPDLGRVVHFGFVMRRVCGLFAGLPGVVFR